MTFITADQVAKITGHSDGRAFLVARDRLEREHHFPAPLPTCLRPLKWRKEAVQAWTDAQGYASTSTPSLNAVSNVVLLHEASRP